MIKKIFLLIVTIASLSLHAASFDCAKAAQGVEQTICNVAVLSSLDEQVAKLYKSLRAKTPDQEKLRAEQISWVKESRRCGTNALCIETAYRKRIAELEASSDEKKSTPALTVKGADFVLVTKSGDREVIYDKNSIARNGGFAEMMTGVNFLNGVKFDNLSGIYSMTTLSHFDCVGKKGRNSKGYFYSGRNATNNLLSTQTSNDQFADISGNPGLMTMLKIACGN